MRVDFFFDPGCPWTWRTAQWLRQVATSEKLEVRWRSFLLELLLDGQPVPAAFADSARLSRVALRIVEALHAGGDGDRVAEFYQYLGAAIHDHGVPASVALVTDTATALGIDAAPADDPRWDDAITASFTEARQLTGGEVGSPVLALGQPRQGIFGPVLTRPVAADEAVRLWRGVRALVEIGAFSELKRARDLDGPLAADLAPHVER